jgi:hypothetical protein
VDTTKLLGRTVIVSAPRSLAANVVDNDFVLCPGPTTVTVHWYAVCAREGP